MKKIFVLPVIFAVSAAFALALPAYDSVAGDDHQPHALESGLEGALVEEMRTLDMVFRDIVSNVALGNNEAVVETFDRMHGKKERTEEALHARKITLPKNPDKAVLFKKLDGEFHADLRMLERAARKDEQDKMVTITQRLLARCVACHATFRK